MASFLSISIENQELVKVVTIDVSDSLMPGEKKIRTPQLGNEPGTSQLRRLAAISCCKWAAK